jgi:hypothetical protein
VDHRPRPTHPPPARALKAVLDLGAVTTAPGCARAWTRQILWEWRLAGLSDTTEVIVSGLTTNAVLTSRREGRPCIRLILTSTRASWPSSSATTASRLPPTVR